MTINTLIEKLQVFKDKYPQYELHCKCNNEFYPYMYQPDIIDIELECNPGGIYYVNLVTYKIPKDTKNSFYKKILKFLLG